MKLEFLRKIFQEKYPNGDILISGYNGALFESGKLTGKFYVRYNQNQKGYTYKNNTVYSLAERLNLIPNKPSDYIAESNNAIEKLLNGMEVHTLCGLYDTIIHIMRNRTGNNFVTLENGDSYKDDFDRTVYIYKNLQVWNNEEELKKYRGW